APAGLLVLRVGDRRGGRLDGDLRGRDRADPAHELCPLQRAEQRRRHDRRRRGRALAGRVRRGRARALRLGGGDRRLEDQLDLVPVRRLRAGPQRGGVVHQADDFVRDEFGGQGQQRADRQVRDRARALVMGERDAVDRRDVDGVAAVVGREGPARGVLALTAAQRTDGRLQAAAREEREQREHALVDGPGGDVLAAAAGDRDAGVREDRALELLAREQEHVGGGRAEQRVVRAGALGVQRLLKLSPVG